MKVIRILFSLVIIHLAIHVDAQEKHWVIFRDKKDVRFNPYEYFDQKVIEKRKRSGIPLVQESDIPLNSDYCEQLSQYGKITVKSRWLNAVSINLKPEQVKEVSSLDFVKEVIKMNSSLKPAEAVQEIDTSLLSQLHKQLDVFGENMFEARHINGKGVRIAVFDGGFPSVDKLDIFKHLREDGRIIATWDFVKEKEFVYDYNSHGTSVLACIAGLLEGEKFGLATGAEFLLARTEVNSEIFAEEEYWAAAMEWADKNGADIISSSLGYTFHRYFPRQMDGKSVFITRMANIAASKGILVVNSAGNDGDSEWEVISAPADADSVLSVGGISSINGLHISFSSYGPTFDGRLKPNVVAFGHVVTTGKNDLKTVYGTSFSSPLVAGFAACVMQINPDWDNMKVFREIEKSGHLYPYYDYAHGYGVPQAAYFLGFSHDKKPTFHFDKQINFLNIELTVGKEENKVSGNCKEKPYFFGDNQYYLYYHIASRETGKIRKYRVIRMTEADSYPIDLSEIKKGEYVMAHYRGYSEKYILQL